MYIGNYGERDAGTWAEENGDKCLLSLMQRPGLLEADGVLQ